MTVPRSVADVLADHVTLEVESIDRMYCNLYVPGLQHVNGVIGFFRGHRGMPFASSALMDPISKDFVAAIHRYCRDHDVVLAENLIRRGQAACSYSCRMPPSRSRRRTRRLAISSGSAIGVGAGQGH
jgi:hypothetical protein